MSHRKKILIVGVGLFIVFFAGIIWYQLSVGNPSEMNEALGTITTYSGGAQSIALSLTHTVTPAGVIVPGLDATTAAGVAVPGVVAPGNPASTVSYRSFTMTAENHVFSPATVIVNQGDTVDLEITAVGANYAFTQPDYGFNASLPKGRTQRIQFQALYSGDFTFYCSSCGGPSKGPVGHIIVVADQ